VVQAHAEADDSHLLSSVILGVNESILALGKVEGLTVDLISPVCKGFADNFMEEAMQIEGLRIIDGKPLSAERGEEKDSLTVAYTRSEDEEKEAYDLVVLLTRTRISDDMLFLSKQLDLNIV